MGLGGVRGNQCQLLQTEMGLGLSMAKTICLQDNYLETQNDFFNMYFFRSPTHAHSSSSNYSSSLFVNSASIEESGKYYCAANPGQSEIITVHVHHG